MSTAQEIRDRRNGIWSQMREIWDRTGGNPSGEDAQAYDRAQSEYDSLEVQENRALEYERISASQSRVDRTGVVPSDPINSADNDERYERAFNAFLRSQSGVIDLDQSDRQLLASHYAQPMAAQGVGTTTAGGYLVPPAFRDKMVETMKWYGPMLDEAETIPTDTGANLPWPTNDDTANVGAILGENTQVTEQDVVLGTASLDAYMYTSKLVRVSFQLMNDRPDFDTWLARKLGERIGRIWNQHFTTGTGTAQPDGIVTSATVGVTGTGSFGAGGISYANAVNMVESLDPAYGNGPGLQWMGHQTVRKALRLLLDLQNRPLWEPSIQAGAPDTLLGYRFRLNNDMPTFAQNSKSLLFGNIHEAYVTRTVNDIRMMRLNERYADFLQVGFFSYARADGTLQNGNAVRVFQATNTA